MSRLRTIGLVAGFDLYESLRSRKALALLLLYLVVALAASAAFSLALNELWSRMTERFGQAASEEILASEQLVKLLAELLGDDEALARTLLTVPPLALFYGWLATTALPLVVVLTSTDAVSGEVASGSVRYALFRTDRLGWACGKLLGQTLLMGLGVLIGALGAFVLGAIMLDRFAPGASAWWLLRMAGRATVYGFAYLGVAMCASMLVRSNAAARGIGLLLVMFCWIGGGILAAPVVERAAPGLITAVRQIFPNAHSASIFRPGLFDRLPGMLALIAIGLGYFGLGYARFSRRDA